MAGPAVSGPGPGVSVGVMFPGLAATGAARTSELTPTPPAIFADMYFIGLTLGSASGDGGGAVALSCGADERDLAELGAERGANHRVPRLLHLPLEQTHVCEPSGGSSVGSPADYVREELSRKILDCGRACLLKAPATVANALAHRYDRHESRPQRSGWCVFV